VNSILIVPKWMIGGGETSVGMRNCRIIGSFELEETLKGCLAQLPCSEQGHLQLHQELSAPSSLTLGVHRDKVECSQSGRNWTFLNVQRDAQRIKLHVVFSAKPGISIPWTFPGKCFDNVVSDGALPIEMWSVYRTFQIPFNKILRLACAKHVVMLRVLLLNFVSLRQHTTAFVPSSGRIYSFGLGGNGQLGTGTTSNRKSPFTVKGNWLPYSTQCLIPAGKQHLAYLLFAFLFLSMCIADLEIGL